MIRQKGLRRPDKRTLKKLASAVALSGVLAAVSAHGAIVRFFDDIANEPMPLTEQDLRYLKFGSATFKYYSDREFSALNELLVHRKTRLFTEETEFAELILGDLYLQFDLPDEAETIFRRLLEKDILIQTRNAAWFHQAELYYRRGDYDKAKAILEGKELTELAPEMEANRRLILANIKMKDEDYAAAENYLSSVDTSSIEGAYATYNLGVAMVRSGKIKDGFKVLEKVVNLPVGAEEVNALKDRAALAIGLTALQQKQFDQAREALLRIRVDGPFSNEALLGLGYANLQRGSAQKALGPWLALVRRSPSQPAVQEALVLTPQAYEDLGARPQALAGYQFASQSYREELKKLEQTIIHIRQEGWLDTLKPEDVAAGNDEPMAPLTHYEPTGGPEASYLYKLFASYRFSELYRQYMQMERLRNHIVGWKEKIPTLQETLLYHQQRLQASLPSARQRLMTLKNRYESKHQEVQSTAIDDPISMARPEDSASLSQLYSWDRIMMIEAFLANKPDTTYYNEARERLRRVKGVMLFNIAANAEEQRNIQSTQLTEVQQSVEDTGIRVAALEQLISDGTQRLHSTLGQQLGSHMDRLVALEQNIEDTLERLELVMKTEALKSLAEQRRRLGEQLAEVHLSIARLQDTSVSEKLEMRPAP